VEMLYSTLLVVSAFWLSACPFSLWVGKWLLGKDIRSYGDGNPGTINVFRAGGRKSGLLAMILDLAKGVPFVILAYSFFELPLLAVLAVALGAILGNAFSPILRLKGGKSLAVLSGVLLALPQHDLVITYAIFMLLGFLLIDINAWIAMLGPTGTLIYSTSTRGLSWELLFMLCVLAILVAKHFEELHTIPRFRGKLIKWVQSRKMAKPSR
jgi:acyl-phosphate glycerol 3-phosphate acyltransferase